MTQGNSNEITIAIGYDNVSNINGLVQKDNTNNYILKLNWTPVTNPSNQTSVVYIISYLDKIYQSSKSNFILPISYGTQIFNDARGFGSAYAHNSTNTFSNLSANFIDSPNTTSEIYYNVCHKRSGSSSGIFDGYNMDNTLVLLEVGG